jgi:putative two-component system response regulator
VPDTPRATVHEARILIVDDEHDNLLLLERILARGGFGNVLAVPDPRTVPGAYRDWRPDLVLMDLHMPGLSGFEVIEQLRAEHGEATAPVIVLSGDPDRDVRQRALGGLARDFVLKPFDMHEVLLRITNVLESHLMYTGMAERSRLLEEELQAGSRDLEAARIEILERLAIAAEYRDDETQEHAYRVGRNAALIAERIGCATHEVQLIRRAAVLHDIGKIGVSDAILRKRGPLTAKERTSMHEHTTIGASILSGSDSPVLRLGERISRSHHERWDGAGYPDGRATDETPLASRIVGVADVFDALVNDRPYKRAWPIDRARGEIAACAGAQFDPELVEAFLAIDSSQLVAPASPGARMLAEHAA